MQGDSGLRYPESLIHSRYLVPVCSCPFPTLILGMEKLTETSKGRTEVLRGCERAVPIQQRTSRGEIPRGPRKQGGAGSTRSP